MSTTVYLGPCSSIRNLRLSVPGMVLKGKTSTFHCSWDMEPGDKVWAVNWYRGNMHLLRFIVTEQPPTKVFKLTNFDIDVSYVSFMKPTIQFWCQGLLSDGKTLWLRNVNIHNTGQYSCEVVAENTFLTLIQAAHLQVVGMINLRKSKHNIHN